MTTTVIRPSGLDTLSFSSRTEPNVAKLTGELQGKGDSYPKNPVLALGRLAFRAGYEFGGGTDGDGYLFTIFRTHRSPEDLRALPIWTEDGAPVPGFKVGEDEETGLAHATYRGGESPVFREVRQTLERIIQELPDPLSLEYALHHQRS